MYLFRVRIGILNILFDIIHSFFEAPNTFSDSLHEFGDFLPAEKQQNDECDNDNLAGT